MNPTRGEKRQVIPRWRPFSVTSSLQELASIRGRTAGSAAPSYDWLIKLDEWRNARSLPSAISLVEAAVVENRPLEAVDAARFILGDKSRLPSALLELARSVATSRDRLHRASRGILIEPNLDSDEGPAQRIQTLRNHLRFGPRNVVEWVDLSLAYCTAGLSKKAEHAMRVALGLAPNNRFVLRAAARLYVHLDQCDRAHSILLRSPATKLDPWLSAAELATASLTGKTPRLIKTSRALIEDGDLLPHDLTELTAALGTIELNSGREKIGRRLLAKSIAHPNDNALAQVEWADRTYQTKLITPGSLLTPLSFEARAWDAYMRSDFERCIAETKKWVRDETFSTVSWQFLTYLNSCVVHDYPTAISTATKALEINPGNQMIRNNLALSLARSGEGVRAEAELNSIIPNGIEEQAVTTATQGLIRFRQGNHEAGANLYLEAIELARKVPNNKWLSFRAWMFFAYEMAFATPSSAKHVTEVFANRLAKARKLGLPAYVSIEADIYLRDIAHLESTGDLFDQGSDLLEKFSSGAISSDIEGGSKPALVTESREKPRIVHHPRR
jgi:tetratricopeptide (TPR) repeat protein